MKYVILMQVDPSVIEGLSAEDGQRIQDGHEQFMKTTKETGEFLATNALGDPSQSVVVRGRAAGAPEVTDGPFAEAKEFLGGYYLIDVADRARAIELAKMIPDAGFDGLALEIRPVMFSAGADM